jgi:hypothetical protein
MCKRFVTKVNHALPLQPVGLMAPLVVLGFGGCATTWQPITDTQRVALMPSKGEITMAARPGKPIGEMIPVDVAVANGTEEPYRIEPDQVFAINVQGQRIASIPADQAITAASHANALKAGLVGAAKHALGDGIAGAAAGAAVGAAVGTIVASPAQGALLGAAMGGSVGAVGGGIFGGLQGRAAARNDAESQISSLSLQTRDANPNYSVNGYVFFPKGSYTAVEMKLFDEETHESAIRSSPWARNGGTLAAGSTAPVGLAPDQSRPDNSSPTASLRGSQGQPLPPTRIE